MKSCVWIFSDEAVNLWNWIKTKIKTFFNLFRISLVFKSHSFYVKLDIYQLVVKHWFWKFPWHHSIKRQELISEQGAHPGDKPDGEGKENLREKHAELTKKLLEVRNKVHNAEREVKTLQKEILEAGLKLLYNKRVFLIGQFWCFKI